MALEPLVSPIPSIGDPGPSILDYVNFSLSILLELAQVQFVSPATERIDLQVKSEPSSPCSSSSFTSESSRLSTEPSSQVRDPSPSCSLWHGLCSIPFTHRC